MYVHCRQSPLGFADSLKDVSIIEASFFYGLVISHIGIQNGIIILFYIVQLYAYCTIVQ